MLKRGPRAESLEIFGPQVTYTRRKQTSECFNGEKFERPVSRKVWVSTKVWQFPMGFSRTKMAGLIKSI